MTTTTDPFETYRKDLQAALRASTDGVPYTYVAPVRQEIAAVEDDQGVLLPALLCLKVAEAYGAKAEAAMAAAVTLGLLGAMTSIYDDIAAEGEAGLEHDWGMARTLNTLDAFYALAQTRFLEGVDALPADRRHEAIALLDELGHHLSLDLHEGSGRRESLLSAAAAFGGMFGGAEPQQVVALTVFGMLPSSDTLKGLSESAQSSLSTMLAYITNA